VDEQPRKSRFEVIRPLAAGIPGVAIGICIVFITAILAVTPHDLDRLLRSALLFFALVLPLYGLILMLLVLERPMWQSYFILILASAFSWVGIFLVLDHLDGAAARAFGVATMAVVLTLRRG
jgi:hypothetical protein